MNSVETAVIPVAGLGTRFLPATKVVPKELLPIVDRPCLEWVMDELMASGIKKIIFVSHPRKDMIIKHFQEAKELEAALEKKQDGDRLEKIRRYQGKLIFECVHQMEPKGLGHAILQAKSEVKEDYFVVVLPDDLVKSKTPCVQQMIAAHQQFGRSVVALEKIDPSRSHLYGMVGGEALDNRNIQISNMVEKPQAQHAPSDLAIIGRYLLKKDIFEWIENTQAGALGEIQLTDALLKLSQAHGIIGHRFEGQRLDTGQPHGFIHANVVYGLESPTYGSALKALLANP